MRMLALTKYGRLGASSRLRTMQYVPHLAHAGIDVCVQPLMDDDYVKRLHEGSGIDWVAVASNYARRVQWGLRAGRFDVVWVEKEMLVGLPAVLERMMRVSGNPFVADYDDAIFHGYGLSRNPVRRLLASKIDQVMRNAAIVTCGNDYLLRNAEVAGARRVALMPTVIDLARYPSMPAFRQAGSKTIIGWIGSPSTVKYLEGILPALKELARQHPVQLRIIGAHLNTDGIESRCIEWTEESEVASMLPFDVGIMPLPDEPWERGKCGYKLIQYMGCWKPVVASPVGVNRSLVRDGVNGWLASTSSDWVASLGRLVADPSLRNSMGLAGRAMVDRTYHLGVAAPRLVRILRAAAAIGRRSASGL